MLDVRRSSAITRVTQTICALNFPSIHQSLSPSLYSPRLIFCVQRWTLNVERWTFTLLARALLLLTALHAPRLSAQPPAFSQIIVFGDSLSDTGNIRDLTHAETGGMVDFPGLAFNYADGRYTNSSETNPASTAYAGVWHEQLARTFLKIPVASNSLGGGTDYAFGGATTENGTMQQTVITDVTIVLDNMGKQIDDYLAAHPIDPAALYIVWGGTNDLLRDDSAMSVSATAARATALVVRLANAGAVNILVPNLIPLGDIPGFSGDPRS